MDIFYLEPTWIEIYFQLYPHLKKDKSFSSKDLIRFYQNNLSWTEQLEVKEYFCELCDEGIPGRKQIEPPLPLLPPQLPPPVPPLLPILPIPIIPVLLPPSPPFLPPPKTCPPFPPFLLPVYPWIIVPGLDPDILRTLKEILGINEAEAAVLELEAQVQYWREKYWYDYGRHVPKSDPRPYREPTYLWGDPPQNGAEVPQYDTEVPQYDTDPFDDPFFTDDFQEEIEEEWDWDEKYEEWEDLQDEKEAEGGEDTTLIPDIDEKILFYEFERLMEEECERIGITFVWRFWVVHLGITWYYFLIEGEAFEWTIEQLPGVLEELRNISTPDEMEI